MKQNYVKRMIVGLSIAVPLLLTSPVFAHVIVRPDQAGVASVQTFTVSVPSEKDSATVSVRLVFPSGLVDVSPNVQPGWKLDVKKDGTGDSANVTEITWSGGNIPAGQQDQFHFNAQVPDKATTLVWKAYQTYADGSVVSWDQKPNDTPGAKEDKSATPYSETKVIDDLSNTAANSSKDNTLHDQLPFYVSIVAVVIAGVALLKKSKKKFS